jgi:hypothetical protein
MEKNEGKVGKSLFLSGLHCQGGVINSNIEAMKTQQVLNCELQGRTMGVGVQREKV